MQLSPKLGLQKTQFFSIISTKIIVIGTLSYKVFCDKKQNGSLLSPVCIDRKNGLHEPLSIWKLSLNKGYIANTRKWAYLIF